MNLFDSLIISSIISGIVFYVYKNKTQEFHVNIKNRNLTSLTGINFTNNVTYLDCSDNQLTSLEGCPSTVKFLSCSHNQLKSLRDCPSTVTYLWCDHNQLESLEGCPSIVKVLGCSNNQLKSLDYCPSNVKELFCHNNLITSFKYSFFDIKHQKDVSTVVHRVNKFFNRMTYWFQYNKNTSYMLSYLECSNNQLKSLKYCPTSFEFVGCDNNLKPLYANYIKTSKIINYFNTIKNIQAYKNQRLINNVWGNYWYDHLLKSEVNRFCLMDLVLNSF